MAYDREGQWQGGRGNTTRFEIFTETKRGKPLRSALPWSLRAVDLAFSSSLIIASNGSIREHTGVGQLTRVRSVSIGFDVYQPTDTSLNLRIVFAVISNLARVLLLIRLASYLASSCSYLLARLVFSSLVLSLVLLSCVCLVSVHMHDKDKGKIQKQQRQGARQQQRQKRWKQMTRQSRYKTESVQDRLRQNRVIKDRFKTTQVNCPAQGKPPAVDPLSIIQHILSTFR